MQVIFFNILLFSMLVTTLAGHQRKRFEKFSFFYGWILSLSCVDGWSINQFPVPIYIAKMSLVISPIFFINFCFQSKVLDKAYLITHGLQDGILNSVNSLLFRLLIYFYQFSICPQQSLVYTVTWRHIYWNSVVRKVNQLDTLVILIFIEFFAIIIIIIHLLRLFSQQR